MTTQRILPFIVPEPIPPSRGSDRAQEQIEKAHETCQLFRAKQEAIRAMLATGKIVTADWIEASSDE